jgi:hypothetical protein
MSQPMSEPLLTPRSPFYVSRHRFEELVAEAMAEIPD